MAYIGSTPTTQSFVAGTDYFNGTGSQVAFTLSRSVNSVNDIEVIVNNVEQIPSGYLVSGTTLTFSAAPSAGTSNVYVRYLSTTNLSLAIPAGTSASFNTLAYTGTLTGGTGVVNLGSGQVYKDASGNVGIGTASPSQKLEVKDGGIRIYNSEGTDADLRFANNASTAGKISYTSQNMTFTTAGSERARIDSSGNLLVGTTTAQSGVSGGGANALTLNRGANKWGVGPTSDYGNFYIINSSNTGVYLGGGNTAWSAQSDERTKDIIEPITNAAYKVSLLRAVIGKYKTDAEGTRRPFLMAQDFQVALPEAVDVQEDEQGTLGLRYTDTIPLLVAAIQEQQTLITALTARITALESK